MARHRNLVADEARIGQKNKITRRWAKRGTRPSAPHDQRTKSAYIFGAISPKEARRGARPALLQHRRHGPASGGNRQSRRPRRARRPAPRPGRMAYDGQSDLPDNITILPLPPKCPELNPVENIWQFMRDNWLSNRVFKSYDDIVDHCCDAWNKLIDQPWRSCPSGCATGRMGSDQRGLVLQAIQRLPSSETPPPGTTQ